MRNAMKLFGIIALVAMIGLGMVACGPEGDDNGNGGGNGGKGSVTIPTDLRGTWVEGEYKDGTVTAKSPSSERIVITADTYTEQYRNSSLGTDWSNNSPPAPINKVKTPATSTYEKSDDPNFKGGSYDLTFLPSSGFEFKRRFFLNTDKNAFLWDIETPKYYFKQQ